MIAKQRVHPMLPVVLAALAAAGCGGDAGRQEAEGAGTVQAAAEAGPEVREGRVTAPDGTRLYYRQVGDGPQVVVIPFGFYLEDALAPLAAPGRRLVFYDPRGRGRSDAVDTSRVSLDHQMSDLEALRQALGIERMALVGWSGMGMETVVYALRHPERVTRIVQVAPVAPRERPHNQAAYEERRRRLDPTALARFQERRDAGEFEDDPAALCRAQRKLTLPASFADPERGAELAPDVCVYENESPANLGPFFAALLGSFGDYDWRGELERLEIPRLVIHGARDAFPLEGSREWVAGHPHARLLVAEDAAHFPFLEQPEVFFPAVDRFLEGEWPDGARRITTDDVAE